MKVNGFTVLALMDEHGDPWWIVEGTEDVYTCIVGDRTMHVTELVGYMCLPDCDCGHCHPYTGGEH